MVKRCFEKCRVLTYVDRFVVAAQFAIIRAVSLFFSQFFLFWFIIFTHGT